jgi:hypothetical protein
MLAEGSGGGGIDALKICKSKDSGVPPNQIRTNTNAILLNGGPGAESYDAAAENGYTGFSTSGESHETSGMYEIPELVNLALVWARDNTDVRALWSNPEVEGQVYSQVTANGLLTITGASITNHSVEDIGIKFIYADTYSKYGNAMTASQKLYPLNNPSIVAPNFGVAHPGANSGFVPLTSSPIYNSQYMNVLIRVKSSSGRYGDVGAKITLNP